MNLKKAYLTIVMIFSILTTFSSCNNQGNSNNAQRLIKQEFNNDKKTELDLKATVIYRDKKDNLWFASKEKGVYRYDGENLSFFTSNDGLHSYNIISVQEDSVGNLYFDTPDGVFKYDKGKFATIPIAKSEETENEWKSE